jgi:membrane protein insertase Oxa1/YidC/SpoIIIJ
MKMLREKNAPLAIRTLLMKTNLKSLNALYKRQKINPLSIFYSPILQIPFFWYISIDLRKIVNGLDPELAQQLVENGVAWLPDLTEPDPFYGLAILAGIMLYGNVEVATGRHNLVGKSAAKADTAVLLKDIFQSVAIFMPCFTAQLAGKNSLKCWVLRSRQNHQQRG